MLSLQGQEKQPISSMGHFCLYFFSLLFFSFILQFLFFVLFLHVPNNLPVTCLLPAFCVASFIFTHSPSSPSCSRPCVNICRVCADTQTLWRVYVWVWWGGAVLCEPGWEGDGLASTRVYSHLWLWCSEAYCWHRHGKEGLKHPVQWSKQPWAYSCLFLYRHGRASLPHRELEAMLPTHE